VQSFSTRSFGASNALALAGVKRIGESTGYRLTLARNLDVDGRSKLQ
jgi:hypothetical protein